MKRKLILILIIGVMLSLLLPPNAAAVDGLVVGSTVELSYEEKFIGTDGKTYHGGDVRNASVNGRYQSICIEWGVEYKGSEYTVSDAKADPAILRAIYYFEQIKDNTASYPDAYAGLQFVIWDPAGSWAPGDIYSVKDRPAEAAYHYILQGVKSGTPSDAELNAHFDNRYCLLDSPVAGQRQFVWAVPTSAKGSISIHKVDADNNPLAGAVFTITSDDNPFFSMDIETDANGYAATGADALDFGTYKIVETTPPPGYPDVGWWRKVTLDSGNQDITITVVNRKQGSIGIQKVDQYGNPVPGVVLEIGTSWTDDGDDPEGGVHKYVIEEVIATVTTDENGYAVISQTVDGSPLAEGTYYVLETSAPEGYEFDPNTEPYEVTLVGNTTTWITIENHRTAPETKDIPVTKQWKDGGNAWGLRPDTVTLRLLANGVEVARAEVSGDATADTWSYTFTDLPIDEGGVPIVYTVTEDPVRCYSTEIDGLTVINRYVHIVPTGIEVEILPYAVLMLFGALGSVALFRRKDR